jgi:hypothetical protein
VLAVSQEVWLPLATLVGGYLFSLLTEAFRDKRQRDREEAQREDEREVRETERRQLAEAQRQEFQRSTLLELQEVLHDLGRTYGHMHYLDVMSLRKTGSWKPRPILDEEMNAKALAAEQRSNILLARVADESLRNLVRAIKEAGGRLTTAQSETESNEAIGRSFEAFTSANERIGELLRST